MNVLAMSRQMNDVQRLAPQCEDSGNGAPAFAYMDEDPLGSFVRYTDYAEVRRLYQAEISTLQQQLAAAREALQAADADAARYRFLRSNCVREWESDMPHNKGAPSLDIEFDAPGHDLDAAIGATLQRDRQP